MRFQYTQEGARPSNGKVLLDGYDASSAVSGFTVHSSVHDLTTVTLDVVVLDGAGLDMDADVLIPAPVAALLVATGWTPPEGAEAGGGALRLMKQAEPQPPSSDEVDVTEYGNTRGPIRVGGGCTCWGREPGGLHGDGCPEVA